MPGARGAGSRSSLGSSGAKECGRAGLQPRGQRLTTLALRDRNLDRCPLGERKLVAAKGSCGRALRRLPHPLRLNLASPSFKTTQSRRAGAGASLGLRLCRRPDPLGEGKGAPARSCGSRTMELWSASGGPHTGLVETTFGSFQTLRAESHAVQGEPTRIVCN